MPNEIIMRWPELEKQVRIAPTHHNREVFDWFGSNLPSRCVQTCTVVAGFFLFMLNMPIDKEKCNWIQEELPLEDVMEMPVGRLSFFMTTGNVANLSCKFGQVTEPMSYVTWADVRKEDQSMLEEVGAEIWENTIWQKRPIHVEFMRVEG